MYEFIHLQEVHASCRSCIQMTLTPRVTDTLKLNIICILKYRFLVYTNSFCMSF